MNWIYVLIAGIGIAINLVIWVMAAAAQPGPRRKTTFGDCVFLLIPFSILLAPLLQFLISPWKK